MSHVPWCIESLHIQQQGPINLPKGWINASEFSSRKGIQFWSHLGSSRKNTDRQAEASVAPPVAPVPPRSPNSKHNPRWRRYNPMGKLRWRMNMKAAALPVSHGQKVKAVRPAARPTKLNLVNPLYYIRRIKNKLTKTKRQRTPA